MAVFHCSLEFSQDIHGWVEQFYRQEATIDRALAATVRLASARYGIVGAGVSINRVKVSQVGVPRASISAGVPGRALSNPPAMLPYEGADVRLASRPSPAHWRNYCLRGLPRGGLVNVNGVWRWGASIQAAATAWLSLLTSQGWLLDVQAAIADPVPLYGVQPFLTENHTIWGQPLAPVEEVDSSTFLFIYTQTQPPAGAQRVRVYGVKVTPNIPFYRRAINGNYAIVGTNPFGVLVNGASRGAQSAVGGFAEFTVQKFIPIAKASLVSQVVRKCGPARGPSEPVEAPPAPVPLATPFAEAAQFNLPPAANAPPPPPPEQTIKTARDMVKLIYQGYSPPGPNPPLGIGIARVTNLERPTWLVVLSGIDNEAGQAPNQWANALASGVGLPDQYTNEVRRLIREFTADNGDIIVAGHSLGGMTATWMTAWFPTLQDRRVTHVLTFGSPPMTLGLTKTSISNFAVRGDPLVYAPPLGNFFWTDIIGGVLLYYGSSPARYLLLCLGLPVFGYKTVDAGDTPLDPYLRHMCYPDLADLDNFSWTGIGIRNETLPPLEIGPVARFEW